MATDDPIDRAQTSFLGTGWSFPPSFTRGDKGGAVEMTEDEADIAASLEILFRTAQGERFLAPEYGLSMRELLFEPMTTGLRTFLKDRIRTAILIFEPRINLIGLNVESPDAGASGELRIELEYTVRATNSRYNLVVPFYKHDSNELRASVGLARR